MNHLRSLRPLIWLLTALALVTGSTVGAPLSARAAGEPTLTVQSGNLTVGGTVAVSGTGWTTADGTSGSIIAVKIDEGAYSHLPGETVHPNATVWALIEAADDGSFSTAITLPTATSSTPAFAPGVHSLRFLTGSSKAGDAIRTLRSDDLTVSAPAAATTTAVSVLRRSSPYGTANVATVSLTTAGAGTAGTVVLRDGSWTTSVAVPAAGVAKVSLPAGLGVGAHKLTAGFAGRTGLSPSTGSVSYTVVKATSSSALALNKTKIKKSKRAVATVKIKAAGIAGPTGSVKIYDGSKVVTSASLAASAKGSIKITLPKLKKGTHKITAVYAGSGTVKGSSSKVVALKVTK